MRRWHQTNKRTSRVEIIPMIDVMMFLLVFFVLISVNVLPASGISLVLPASDSAADLERRRVLTVSVAADDSIHFNGEPVPATELGARLSAFRQANPQAQAVLQADASARMQSLVGAMDALRLSGYEAFAIATKRPR